VVRLGDLVAGRFRLEDMAGTGGMGAVYRAIDRDSGQPVAIKVLRADSVEHVDRFAREIRVLEQLRHPGIVRYVADGSASGELWLAMEWLDGESLSHRLRHGIEAADAIAVIRRVAEALGAAHDLGVVHRDVKPSNLFLLHGDLAQVKVLDFGVARITEADQFSTRTGMMIGTPGYMAPEQARGDRGVGPRADVFALGCVLFQALTGSPPFTGDHMMAVLAKILLDEAPRLADLRPELSGDLDRLLARCLSKQPDERPANGGELAMLLGQLGTFDTVVDKPVKRASLTRDERKLLSVVLLGGGDGAFDTIVPGPAPLATIAEISSAPTTSSEGGASDTQVLAALRESAAAHGGSLERLVDGSHVVMVTGGGTAGDQAAQAARCALALKVVAPNAPIALATGRAVMAGRWPVGEVIDRAASLLDAPDPGAIGVRIDDVTAGLLDARFEIGGDSAGLYVLGEHDALASTRTLLGKPTPCVGRDRELGVLVGLYDECVAEPLARAVLVTGAAGIGKSRLGYELGRRAADRGEAFELWVGRGDPLRAGSPYGILAPALRRAAGIQDGEPLDTRRHKLVARVRRNASVDDRRTTLFLGELIGCPFDDDDRDLRAARADSLLMAEQIKRAFEHFVGIETAAQPLAIVLEDLQWGDVPSVKLIDAALRALPDRPLFVLALARPEIHERFPKLWADRGVQELRLDELTKKGSERLVRGVLGDAASDSLVARIVEQAGGNAFYLEELIRAAAEGKRDALPETVLAVVQTRLERLEGDARHILRAASIFGERFWRGGVVELVGGSNHDSTNAWLDELVHRELIARAGASRFPGQEELRFRHGLVREAAYAMLTDADKKLGHQLAGAWLARAGESDPMVLGEHAERAGDEARAGELYRAGAERALAACDFAGAEARAEQAFGCGAKGEARGALRLVQAEARRWLGEFAQAARCGLDAIAILPRGSAAWFAAVNEAAESSGKIDDVATLEQLGRALQDTPAADRAALAARLTGIANLAFQLFSHAANALALALLDDVERAAIGVTEPSILARVYQARSSRSMFTGDAGAYLDSEQAAAAAFERAGDLRYACVQRGNVGYACLEIGAYAEAERALRDALDQATRLGLANVAATVKHNLGRALMMRGALDEALKIETDAFESFAAQGDRRLASAARGYRALILAAMGELGAAEGELLGALEVGQLPLQSVVHAHLARVLVRAGRPADALGHARRGHAILEQLGAIEEGESTVRLALAEALAATGDAAGAQAALAAARQRVLDRAARISDPQHRERFLTQIPEHVATLAGRLT
jgi:tetratricopeptide (TPR) repeat protein